MARKKVAQEDCLICEQFPCVCEVELAVHHIRRLAKEQERNEDENGMGVPEGDR